MHKPTKLVTNYGLLWARNADNLGAIPAMKGHRKGIYILYDGSLPIYIGKGVIADRIAKHERKTWSESWDRFSWFILTDSKWMHDVEAIILTMLPPSFRPENNLSSGFKKAKKAAEANPVATIIKHTRPPHRNRKKH